MRFVAFTAPYVPAVYVNPEKVAGLIEQGTHDGKPTTFIDYGGGEDSGAIVYGSAVQVSDDLGATVAVAKNVPPKEVK